jgi:hypothetical protein
MRQSLQTRPRRHAVDVVRQRKHRDERPIEPELAEQLLPVKYREEFVEEYWAAWQRRVTRDGGGLGGARL